MFTGLIQSLGTLALPQRDRVQITCLRESASAILQDLNIGDSVAVDGICLTVVKILPQGFVAAISPETLSRTTLNLHAQQNTFVNLETSLRIGSKLGGHFVTGHVDGVGCLHAKQQTANAWELEFMAPEAAQAQWQRRVAPYLVEKGSIAINGISLTIADCDRAGSCFKVAVIPHTFEMTNLRQLQTGSLVNLEADILGKYVARFVQFSSPQSANEAQASLAGLWPESTSPPDRGEPITPDFLAEHGY